MGLAVSWDTFVDLVGDPWLIGMLGDHGAAHTYTIGTLSPASGWDIQRGLSMLQPSSEQACVF